MFPIMRVIKDGIIYFIKIVNSVFATVNCTLVFFRLVGSGRRVYVNVEGGFGHTLAAPTCLRSLDDGMFVLVFFYTKERHNYLTKNAFDGDFIWCPVTLPGLPYFSLRVHQLLGRVLVRLLDLFTPSAHDLREFFDEATFEPWMVDSDFYQEYYSDPYRRTYMFRLAPSVDEILKRGRSNYYIDGLNFNPLESLIGTSRKICAIAHREFGISRDVTKHIRNSRSISELVAVVSYLTDVAGYHVILCGNVHGRIFEEFQGNPAVTYPAMTGLQRDEYDFYAGMLFDVFIGPMSGGLDYARCRQVPTLILDSFPYGWASPRATLAFRDKKFACVEELRDFFATSYQDYSVNEVDFVPEPVALAIVREFIEGINDPHAGIDPRDLGIDAGPLIDGRCRISSAWYQYCVRDSSSSK